MNWHILDNEHLPLTTRDVELILKIENTPMQYACVVWSGDCLWMLSREENAPWERFPFWVKITHWAFIDEKEEEEYSKNGRL